MMNIPTMTPAKALATMLITFVLFSIIIKNIKNKLINKKFAHYFLNSIGSGLKDIKKDIAQF